MKKVPATRDQLRFSLSYCGLDELHRRFDERREMIRHRLTDFRAVGSGSDEGLFAELCFCLLTPQSKARSCDKAIQNLTAKGLLVHGTSDEVARELRTAGVRFHNGKARWIVAAREQFHRDGRWVLQERLGQFATPFDAREWLVDNITGLGYKEAAHFLRNIGRGEDLAILDRHIMRNLHRHGVLEAIPKSLSRRKYMETERLMKQFSEDVGITLAELDLLFWSTETGEVFK